MRRLVVIGLLAAVSASVAGTTAEAQVTQIAPGVTHTHVVDATGPQVINVIKIDLRGGRYMVRHVRAKDSLVAREKLTAMVARQPEGAAAVVAAINADFFIVRTGENENNQVIGGEWWKGVRGPDSQFDAFGIVRTQFGLDARGRPLMDRFTFDGTAVHNGAAFPVHTVNYKPRGGSEAVVLFTERYGRTPRDTVRTTSEVTLRPAGARGDTALFIVATPVSRSGGNTIGAETFVLAAYGPRAATFARFTSGDTVRLVLRAMSQTTHSAVVPQLLIGGWPRILRGGQSVAERAPWDEVTISSNAEARHPRSAIGFSRDSSTLILMTVDGRQASSAGVTITELAALMRAQGAWDALNFDGGGSTTLVVRGRVVNSPSDPAGERAVGNAVLVVSRP